MINVTMTFNVPGFWIRWNEYRSKKWSHQDLLSVMSSSIGIWFDCVVFVRMLVAGVMLTTRSILTTTKRVWRIQIPILIIYIYIQYVSFVLFWVRTAVFPWLEREREIITLLPTNSIRLVDEFNYLDIMMKQGPSFGTAMMIVTMMTLMSTTMTTAFTPTFHPTKLQSSSSFSSIDGQ